MAGMVPWSTRLAYAAPALAVAAVGLPVYVHAPKFYTDVVGVPVTTVGVVVLLARVFDAVTDPLVGGLSDRTRTRWGRRRPWLLVGGVGVALCFLALMSPPAAGPLSAGWGATAWFTAALLGVFAAWTMVVVPYEALGNELSEDFDERTTVLGLRDGLLLIGTLVAAALPEVLDLVLSPPSGSAPQRDVMRAMGLVYAPFMAGLCALAAWRVPERAAARPPTAPLRFRDGLDALRQNPAFASLLVGYTVNALGSNLPGTLILFYVSYVLHSARANLFLALYLAVGILVTPLWIPISRALGKARAYLLAMALNVGSFVWVFFLGPGDEAVYGLLVVLSALGMGGTLVVPSSMQADVIDYDELITGTRREGLYVGLWSVSRKLSAALGVGLALPILDWAGYVPNGEQPEAVLFALRVLYALVPTGCALIAAIVLVRYPIGRAEHEAIRTGIAAHRAGQAAPDPLRPGLMLPALSPPG